MFSETSPSAPGTVASSQTVTSAANYLPPGVAGPVDDYEALDIVAELVGASGGTLDIYVQTNPTDDNANWFDLVHFTQLTNGNAAVKYQAPISLYNNAIVPVVVGKNLSPALAAGASINGAFGSRLRLVMVAGSGTSAGAAVKVTVAGQRPRMVEYGQ